MHNFGRTLVTGWLVFVVIKQVLQVAEAMIAYDCAHPLSNLTKIDMLESEPCHIEELDTEPTIEEIMLLENVASYPVHTYQCKVSIIRMVMSCGTFSDSMVKGGLLSYILDLSQDQCKDMHTHRSFNLFGQHRLNNIPANGSHTYSITLAGSAGPSGKCSSGFFSDHTGSWEGVYVLASVDVEIHDGLSQVSNEDQLVLLPSGYKCPKDQGNCVDPDRGFTFWQDLSVPRCETHDFEMLYKGMANKSVINFQGHVSTLYTTSGEIAFSLMVKSQTTVCGHKAYSTEHPKLRIVPTQGLSYDFKQTKNAYNMDLFTYMNSKFVYVERHIQNQIKSLHKTLLMNQCRIERDLLNTQLALAYSNPSEFAYLRMNKPGFTALPAGEVMYLVQCQAVQVRKVKTEKCFNELPITYNNKTYFMTPRSHLIQDKGSEVQCSDITPSHFKIDGSWFSFSPSSHQATKPNNLIPKSNDEWQYIQPVNLATSGIYTQDDLNTLRKQLMFPLDKGATLSAVAGSLSGQGSDLSEYDVKGLSSESVISSMVDRYLTKATGIFSWLGSSFSVCIGLYFTFKLVKFLFDTGIHGWALYKTYGIDYRMSAMFWDALTTHFLNSGNRRKMKSKATSFSMHSGEGISAIEGVCENLMHQSIEIEPSAPAPAHIKLQISNFITQVKSKVCIPERKDYVPLLSGIHLINNGQIVEVPNIDITSVSQCTCHDQMFSIINT